MFNNLKAELTRRDIRVTDLAGELKMTCKTLNNKVAGKSDFDLIEMKTIRRLLSQPTLSLDYLFEI